MRAVVGLVGLTLISAALCRPVYEPTIASTIPKAFTCF